jgi:transposase
MQMSYIKGNDRNQISFPISLDEQVGKDSTVRVIDALVNKMDLHKMGFNDIGGSNIGRPGYAASDLLKLFIYGYENGIRSSRRLERECNCNIELMWLLKSLRPDHKTIAEFRRINAEPLQEAFRYFVGIVDGFGLIGKRIIAVDGTKIKASNNKKQNFSQKKLKARLIGLNNKIAEYLSDIEKNDAKEPTKDRRTEEILKNLEKRKAMYEKMQKQLDETGANEISLTDPDARLMGNNRNGVDVSYNVQSAVDQKHHFILDFNVTNNPADHGQLSVMSKQVKASFNLKKLAVIADKGYYNGPDLLLCKENQVITIVSRQNPSNKAPDTNYNSDKFIYDSERDLYVCPMGKELYQKKQEKERCRYYNAKACKNCSVLNQCTKVKKREISRSIYTALYDETDKRTEKHMKLYKQRQRIVEHPFASGQSNEQ